MHAVGCFGYERLGSIVACTWPMWTPPSEPAPIVLPADNPLLCCDPQVIDAEIARRKLLEDTPIPCTNEDAVLFDTAEIPWWAWVKRFHLPEVSRLGWRT